jgi:hypothetical protein
LRNFDHTKNQPVVFEKVYDELVILQNASYFKTLDRGYTPRQGEQTNSGLYPWVYMEAPGMDGPPDDVRTGRYSEHFYQVAVVIQAFANEREPEAMNFRLPTQPAYAIGIGDLAGQICDHFTVKYQGNQFASLARSWSVYWNQSVTVKQPPPYPLVRRAQLNFRFLINNN